MSIGEILVYACGAIVSISALWSALEKLILPALKTRDKFKKVDGFDKLREDTTLLDVRVGKLEGYQIKNYESICRIEANVDLIGRGVLSLINNRLLPGDSLEGLQDVKNDMEAKRGFLR